MILVSGVGSNSEEGSQVEWRMDLSPTESSGPGARFERIMEGSLFGWVPFTGRESGRTLNAAPPVSIREPHSEAVTIEHLGSSHYGNEPVKFGFILG